MNEQGLRDLNEEIGGKPKATGLDQVRSVIVVLSGKGGVGKSTVAANLAAGLAMEGLRTGLLDVDVHGPSIPRLLKLTGFKPGMSARGMVPVEWHWNLGVMSIGLLLPSRDDAVIWRGPAKAGVIAQLAEQVDWGPRDVFVVPSWMRHHHEPDEDAVLFSASDRGVQEKLGLWREAKEKA